MSGLHYAVGVPNIDEHADPARLTAPHADSSEVPSRAPADRPRTSRDAELTSGP
jgi:hypothetical protein